MRRRRTNCRGPLDAKPINFPERLLLNFWKRVENTLPHGPDGNCWLWLGSRIPLGYGQLSFPQNGKNRTVRAHRVAYESAYGPIPEGKCVCHSCDVKLCVNPDHLWIGSHQDNMRDYREKGLAIARNRKTKERSKRGIGIWTEYTAEVEAERKMILAAIAKAHTFPLPLNAVKRNVLGAGLRNDAQEG